MTHTQGLMINYHICNNNALTMQVDYINAHATSTRAADLAEFNAINKVFKDTSSIKMN